MRESRGATLEVVISRLKGLNRDIRFIALSATVPNIDDIARWLGPTRNEYGQLSRGVLVGREVINAKEKRALTIDDIPMAKVYKVYNYNLLAECKLIGSVVRGGIQACPSSTCDLWHRVRRK